jgi:hypothetical protein
MEVVLSSRSRFLIIGLFGLRIGDRCARAPILSSGSMIGPHELVVPVRRV